MDEEKFAELWEDEGEPVSTHINPLAFKSILITFWLVLDTTQTTSMDARAD